MSNTFIVYNEQSRKNVNAIAQLLLSFWDHIWRSNSILL